jgi:hypothetical protein
MILFLVVCQNFNLKFGQFSKIQNVTYIQGIKKHFPEDAITNIRKMREKNI